MPVGPLKVSISISITPKSDNKVRRVVRVSKKIVINPHALYQMLIKIDALVFERDFIFKSEYNESAERLRRHGALYAHIVDCNMSFVNMRNDSKVLIARQKHARLGLIPRFEKQKVYRIHFKDYALIA